MTRVAAFRKQELLANFLLSLGRRTRGQQRMCLRMGLIVWGLMGNFDGCSEIRG